MSTADWVFNQSTFPELFCVVLMSRRGCDCPEQGGHGFVLCYKEICPSSCPFKLSVASLCIHVKVVPHPNHFLDLNFLYLLLLQVTASDGHFATVLLALSSAETCGVPGAPIFVAVLPYTMLLKQNSCPALSHALHHLFACFIDKPPLLGQ